MVLSSTTINWDFKGYCKFDDVGGEKDALLTYWAPAIISVNDTLHMFVTLKPGTVPNEGAWGGQGWIVHYKTPKTNPVNGWAKEGVLHADNLNAIDATVYKNENLFHVWFKGIEMDALKNELYHMASSDFQYLDKLGFSKSGVFNAEVTGSNFEEAPNVFQWDGKYWLITDPHNGIFVYNSTDAENWKFQGIILKEGGTRNLDNSMARHCSVAVKDERAFIFYYLELWRRYYQEKLNGAGKNRIFDQPLKNRESVLQMAELDVMDGKQFCDRNITL